MGMTSQASTTHGGKDGTLGKLWKSVKAVRAPAQRSA